MRPWTRRTMSQRLINGLAVGLPASPAPGGLAGRVGTCQRVKWRSLFQGFHPLRSSSCILCLASATSSRCSISAASASDRSSASTTSKSFHCPGTRLQQPRRADARHDRNQPLHLVVEVFKYMKVISEIRKCVD